jgi:hypothetical protein
MYLFYRYLPIWSFTYGNFYKKCLSNKIDIVLTLVNIISMFSLCTALHESYEKADRACNTEW